MALGTRLTLLIGLAAAIGVIAFGTAVHNDWLFRVTTLIMLAVSWNLMANAGLVSLGHSAFWGIGSYATILSANKLGLPYGLAFIPALLAGGLLGLMLARATGRLKGIFFSISTLALSEGLRVVALMTPNLTGGAVGLFLKNESRPSDLVLFGSGLAGAVACIWFAYALSRTRFHYACRGMRDNEEAVQMLGVDPRTYRRLVMVISGAMASLAGAIYSWYGGYLEPEIAFNLHYTIQAQIAPILGGIHTLAGPIVGSVAIVFLSEVTRIWLGKVEGASLLIYGVILTVCILFMPRGLVGLLASLKGASRKGPSRAASPPPSSAPAPSAPAIAENRRP